MDQTHIDELKWLFSVKPIDLYQQETAKRFLALTNNARIPGQVYVTDSPFEVSDIDAVLTVTFHFCKDLQKAINESGNNDGMWHSNSVVVDDKYKDTLTWTLTARKPVMRHTLMYRLKQLVTYTALPDEIKARLKDLVRITYHVEQGTHRVRDGNLPFIWSFRNGEKLRSRDEVVASVTRKQKSWDGEVFEQTTTVTRNKTMSVAYVKGRLATEIHGIVNRHGRRKVVSHMKMIVRERADHIKTVLRRRFNIHDGYDEMYLYRLGMRLPFDVFVAAAQALMRLDQNERHLLLQRMYAVTNGLKHSVTRTVYVRYLEDKRKVAREEQDYVNINVTHLRQWFETNVNLNTLETVCKVFNDIAMAACGRHNGNVVKDVHVKAVKKILHAKTSRQFILQGTAFVNEHKTREMAELERLFPKEFAAVLSTYGVRKDPQDIVLALRDLPVKIKERKLTTHFTPMQFVVPVTTEKIATELRRLLGSRSEGIKGAAQNPGKLFFELTHQKLWPTIDVARLAEYNVLIAAHAGEVIPEHRFEVTDKNDFRNLISGEVFNNCMAIGYDNKINTYCEDPGFAQFNGYIGSKWVSNSVIWLGEEPESKTRHLIVDNIEGTNTVRHIKDYHVSLKQALREVATAHQCGGILIGTHYNDVPLDLPTKPMTIKPVGLKTPHVYSDAFPGLGGRSDKTTLSSTVMVLPLG